MASRYFNQFLSTLNFNPCWLEGSFQVGATGSVVAGSVLGSGLNASSTLLVQQKSTGTYLLQLADPYTRLLGASFTVMPAISSSQLADGSSAIVVGKTYVIGASSTVSVPTPEGQLGSTGTNWYTLGLPKDQTPYVGSPFVATSAASQLVGSSAAAVGTGVIQQVTNSGIDHVEVIPNANLELNPSSAIIFDNGPGQTIQNSGSDIWLQTMKSSSGAPVNATQGTTIRWGLWLRNSSRSGFNEATTANMN